MTTKSLIPVAGEKYALLIAIEEYHDGHISEVTYAENDANSLAAALFDTGISPSNLEIMLSASATKTRIESAIRTLCQRLRPQDKLLLFYAGHGFAENGNNFITGHDAILSDLSATCIRLQDIFTSIQSSKAGKAVILLDARHRGLGIDGGLRGGLTEELVDDEFVAFCAESEHYRAFASTSLAEKSHPSKSLKHGIWSHHVIQAYRGEEPKALEKNSLLTASSLTNYLRVEVPRTLRHTVAGAVTQTPGAWGDPSQEFTLADLGDVLARRKPSTPASVGSLKRASFWGFASGSIKSLKGFKRHHRVPDTVTDSTRIFVHQVGADDLHEAATAIHSAIKTHFRYRRRDLEQNEDHGAVTIMTPQFTVNITLDVDNDEATRYEMATEVSDIRDPTVLGTEAFASVFDGLFDRIVFHVSGEIPIDDVIDAIESIQDADLISVTYPPNAEQCTIRAKGLTCELVFDRQEITLQMKGKTETAKLLEESHALPRLLLDRGLWGLLPGSERT